MTPLADAFTVDPLPWPHWEAPGGSVLLINADALQVLPMLRKGCVDLCLTDPPYNVGIDYATHDDNMPAYAEWCSTWFAELRRASTGAVTLSCGQVNLPLWCSIEPPHWTLCWHKPAAMGRSPVGFCNWEPMPLWGKSKGKGGCDVVKASILPSSDLDGHPCPKPVEWATGFVSLLTLPGMTVLDCFSGIATTPVACIQTGRRCIAIELDPAYYAIGVTRCKQAIANSASFFGRPAQTTLPLPQV